MNTVTPTQSMSELISGLAVILDVRTSSLAMTRVDKEASREADIQHNAEEGTSRVTAKRLPAAKARVTEIDKVQKEAHAVKSFNCMVWGKRWLLVNTSIEKVLGELARLKDKHDKLAEQIVLDADYLILESEAKRGTFNVDSPTIDEIRGAFSLEYTIEPVPNAANFKSSLSTEMENELRRQFEDNVKAAYVTAQRDLMKRLAEPLNHYIDTMARLNRAERNEKDPDVPKGVKLYDTTITSITDLAKILDGFNLTNDPVMTQIVQKLKVFERVSSDTLKKSQALREATAARAKEIITGLGDWVTP